MVTESGDYPGVRAYVHGLYAQFRIKRLMIDIGANHSSMQGVAMNAIF